MVLHWWMYLGISTSLELSENDRRSVIFVFSSDGKFQQKRQIHLVGLVLGMTFDREQNLVIRVVDLISWQTKTFPPQHFHLLLMVDNQGNIIFIDTRSYSHQFSVDAIKPFFHWKPSPSTEPHSCR